MKQQIKMFIALLAGGLCASHAHADARYFTYTYEPETEAAGDLEFEQSTTLRTLRNRQAGQENYQAWELRQELEYGVTGNYTVALYLNTKAESYRDSVAGRNHSSFKFDGVSLENRYLVLDPVKHAVGLALYLEPRISDDEAELEQKIILGQRHGDWKWAFNLSHATEWGNNFSETKGELETSLGLARDLAAHWTVGVELRDVNALPEYRRWEYTALYLGPAISYHRQAWWATLSVMPQIYGANFDGNPDGNSRLVLDEQERLNVRLIFGFEF
jgi:hypothetical protein